MTGILQLIGSCSRRFCRRGCIAAILALLLCCIGCSRIIYVPTETTRTELRTDTLRQVQLRTDSIYRRDSIYIEGAAIVKERWRERYITLRDTIYKARVDTAYQFREVTKMIEVERPLRWWQRSLIWLGAALAIGALLAYCARRFCRRAQ